jgi:hypothetical protein
MADITASDLAAALASRYRGTASSALYEAYIGIADCSN